MVVSEGKNWLMPGQMEKSIYTSLPRRKPDKWFGSAERCGIVASGDLVQVPVPGYFLR